MTAQLPPELASAFSLEGKVALVTGSTMGIGEATARVLAQAGAHVIISSRKQNECDAIAAGFHQQGLSAEGRACHIGRMEDIEAMSAWLKEAHGGLDILVNNAVLSPWRTIEDTEVGLFTKTVEVDLRGYWFMSVEAVRLMRSKGGGSIVNLASVAALHPDHMLSLYSTLKTALIGMSRSFALEFGGEGVRVNTVLPGVIQTKLADAFDADTKKRIVEKTTVKRLGEPEDIGYAVLYLCSNAGAYVSGTNLVVDGGFSVALM
ncbi:MAG: glucose 1-dehydrogenase [Marinobacter sp.]